MSNKFIYINQCSGISAQQLDTAIRKEFKYSNVYFRVIGVLNGSCLIVCKSTKHQKELHLSKIYINRKKYQLFIPQQHHIKTFKYKYKQQYGSPPNLNFNNNNQRRKSRRKTRTDPKKPHKYYATNEHIKTPVQNSHNIYNNNNNNQKEGDKKLQRGCHVVDDQNKVVFYYPNFHNNNNDKLAPANHCNNNSFSNDFNIFYNQQEGNISDDSKVEVFASIAYDGNETINIDEKYIKHQKMALEKYKLEKELKDKQLEEAQKIIKQGNDKYNWPMYKHIGNNNKCIENGTYDIFDRFTETDGIRFWQYYNKYNDGKENKWFTFNFKISDEIDRKYKEFQQYKHASIVHFGETNKLQIINFENMTINNNERVQNTNILIGYMYRYGIIQFRGFSKPMFLIYDRKNGYGYVKSEQHKLFHPEKEIDIMNKVYFRVYYNKLEYGEDEYAFTIKNKICNKDFIAYDIIKYNEDELIYNEDEKDTEITEVTDVNLMSNEEEDDIKSEEHMILMQQYGSYDTIEVSEGRYNNGIYVIPMNNWWRYDANCLLQQPIYCQHKEYKNMIFDGIILAKDIVTDSNGTVGIILCGGPKDTNNNEMIELLYHSSFFVNPKELNTLKPGDGLTFSIGMRSENKEEKNNSYDKSYDIKYAFNVRQFKGQTNIKYLERKCKGQIWMTAPIIWVRNLQTNVISEIKYNNKYNNNSNGGKYKINMYGRYNEKQKNSEGYVTDFKIIPPPIQINNQRNKLIYGRYLYMPKEYNKKYKYQLLPVSTENSTDLYSIVEISEMYFNLFLNNGGGVLYFGIDINGKILGQKYINTKKIKFIKRSIDERLKWFKPTVYAENFNISFQYVYDSAGFLMDDCKVIKIEVYGCKLPNDDWFKTANDCFYTKSSRSIIHPAKDKVLPCPPLEQHYYYN